MPLNRQNPRRAGPTFRSLDQSILAPPRRHQASCKILDGLVVYRIDRGPERSECCGCAAPRFQPDNVGARVPGARRAMVHRARALRRKVLKESPAERHIYELNTSADPQDRQTSLPRYRKERQLEQVTVLTRRAQMRRWLGAVPGRVDVLTE